MAALRPIVHESVTENRRRAREQLSNGLLPHFSEGDYVLVARDDFFKGGNLCLHWRGLRRIFKAHNGYVFDVENLRNGKNQSG